MSAPKISMSRWFNTAGPCEADIHYMLDATVRLPDLSRLIEQRSHFVIHAPRQTGKTTAMLALAKELTESGNYTGVMVSAEVGSPFSDDPGSKVNFGWLFVFDRRKNAPPFADRLGTKVATTKNGRSVTIVRA